MLYIWNKNNVTHQSYFNKKQTKKKKKRLFVDFLSFLLSFTPLDKNLPRNLFKSFSTLGVSVKLWWDHFFKIFRSLIV